MARRREHLSAYLHTCVSAYLHKNKIIKKTRKNQYTPSESNDQHLNIKVLAGSIAYMSICVFSEEITA